MATKKKPRSKTSKKTAAAKTNGNGERPAAPPRDTRDYVGYGEHPPHANWPGGARVAVQFVLNYEEGGENCVLNGDAASETFLSEIINAPRIEGRHISMESIYEYGTRAGVWRLLRLFKKYKMPVTVFAVALALEKYPAMAKTFLREGHEIASHGYRWINYQDIDIKTERDHMKRAVEIIERLSGERPLGWYTGRTSPNTRRLVMEDGSFLYDADDYSDDLPFWYREADKKQLVVPYTLDTNDMRFAAAQGFNSGDQYFAYLRDAFDVLYEEGEHAPKMLSVGLHCRIVGRPARMAALERFIQHIKSHDKVWIARRIDIARHWMDKHPYKDAPRG
jgi:putative urate catabolism protein